MSVIALPVPRFTPPVVVDPEKIISVLAPMLAMPFCKMAFDPWPISVMAMTAATAMMTPRADSPDRILFRRSAPDSAVRHVAGSSERCTCADAAPAASFVPSAVQPGLDGCTSCRSQVSVTSFVARRLRPVRRFIALDHSVHDANGPMGVGGHVGIVRHQDDGDSLGVELLEHPQDFDARVRIEVARRLVGQQQARAIDQRAADRHPLLLPARHLRRLVMDSVGQPDAVQQVVRQAAGFAPEASPRGIVQRHQRRSAAPSSARGD